MSLWKTMRSRRLKKDAADASTPASLVLRGGIALGLLAIGITMLSKAYAADVLFTALPIIAGGILLGPFLSQLIAAPFGALFWPKLRAPDQPVFSTASSCRYQGRYEEAISHYRQILNEFPSAFKAHADLIEMTAIDMEDLELSRRFLMQANTMITDTGKRGLLAEIFEAAQLRYEAAHSLPTPLKVNIFNSSLTTNHASESPDEHPITTNQRACCKRETMAYTMPVLPNKS